MFFDGASTLFFLTEGASSRITVNDRSGSQRETEWNENDEYGMGHTKQPRLLRYEICDRSATQGEAVRHTYSLTIRVLLHVLAISG